MSHLEDSSKKVLSLHSIRQNYLDFMESICKSAIAVLFMGIIALASCSKDDDFQMPEEQTGVPRIILDVDICSSTDDLFAMEMLYRYADQGRCRFLGVVVDREGEGHAAFADVMNTYF